MKKRPAVIATAAAVLLLPGLLAACSSGAPSSDSTTARPDRGGAGPAVALCMREKGYDMEDPKDESMTIAPPEGVDQDQWMQDFGVCAGVGKGAAGDSNQAAKPMPGMEEKAAQAAACLRENGFEDYPDDMDAQAEYTPSGDQETFDAVAKQCDEKVWGSEVQGIGQ